MFRVGVWWPSKSQRSARRFARRRGGPSHGGGQCHGRSTALQSTFRRWTKSSPGTTFPFRVAGGRALTSPQTQIYWGLARARPPATHLKRTRRRSLKNGIAQKKKRLGRLDGRPIRFSFSGAAFAKNGDSVLKAVVCGPRGEQSGRENNSSRLPVCHEPNLRLASNFVVSTVVCDPGICPGRILQSVSTLKNSSAASFREVSAFGCAGRSSLPHDRRMEKQLDDDSTADSAITRPWLRCRRCRTGCRRYRIRRCSCCRPCRLYLRSEFR